MGVNTRNMYSCLQKCNKLNKSHLVGQLLNSIHGCTDPHIKKYSCVIVLVATRVDMHVWMSTFRRHFPPPIVVFRTASTWRNFILPLRRVWDPFASDRYAAYLVASHRRFGTTYRSQHSSGITWLFRIGRTFYSATPVNKTKQNKTNVITIHAWRAKTSISAHMVRHPRCVFINYNWINQLSNTTIWWLDIYVVYYIGINYMFRLLWPSSGW
jgi:hypothetical protein